MFGNQAIQADVEFRTNTGQFRADMSLIRGEYARTTGAMSTESLRAAVAQEKLDRVLAKNTADSYAARRATIAYRNEMASLNGQAGRTASGLAREERELGGLGRGLLAGSGLLGRFGRAAVFASTSVLGGYGLIFAVKSLIKAADDEAVALSRVGGALETSGLKRREYKQRIDEALAAEVRLTGFEKTDLANALAANIIRFGDVNKALHANAIAADVARQKGVDLASAQQMIQRASFGNPRAAKQLGIELEKTTTNMDALKASTKNASAEQIANAKAADLQANETANLAAVAQKYHGDAARYLQTSAGKQALFNAELKQSEVIIGDALLPTISKYAGKLAAWLDQMNRSGKLERDVNHAAHDTAAVFHTIETILGPLENGFGGLGKAVGGTAHELQLLTAVAVGLAGRKALVRGGVLSIGSAAATAEGEVVGLQGALIGLSGAGVMGSLAALAVRLGGLSKLLAFAGPEAPAIADALAVANGKNPFDTGQSKSGLTTAAQSLVYGRNGQFSDQLYKLTKSSRDAAVSTDFGYADPYEVIQAYNAGKISRADFEKFTRQLFALDPELARVALGRGATPFDFTNKKPRSVTSGRGQHGALATNDHSRGAGGGVHSRDKATGLVLGLDYRQQNALLVAQATKGTADDLKVLNHQLGILNSALTQKGLNPGQTNQLLTARDSVLSQIDTITSTNTSSAQEAERKRQAAAKKKLAEEQQARRKRVQRLTQVPAGLRIEEANARARSASEQAIVAILEKEKKALEQQVKQLRAIGASKDDIAKATENEARVQARIDAAMKKKTNTGSFGQLQKEFLDSLSQDLGDYAPNVLGGTGPGASAVTVHVHQSFPHPPTDDGRSEAIHAFYAMSAAFDG